MSLPEHEIPFGDPVFEVTDAEAFAAIDEPGAEPLVTSEGGAVIPIGGFVLVYGDAGVSKTTLCIDWSVHFAAGASWLELLEPTRPLRVLVVENEGPRPEFRRKLRRRLDAWAELEGELGSALNGHLRVLSEPWGALTLRDVKHRQALAAIVRNVDLVIAGPLSALGTEGGGTLDEVREFEGFMQDVRAIADHPVAFLLVHHENKAGSVSGAWERAPDTTVHVQAQGHGRTRIYWQKVKWCSALHATTTHLLWADGDTFAVEEREDITDETLAEAILAAARTNPGAPWTTIREGVKGKNTTQATAIRDQLIIDGLLVNLPKRKGGFNLWASDDPAVNRSESGTEPERLSFASSGVTATRCSFLTE